MKPQQIHIDLNCDLGEHDTVQDAAIDQLIMPFISSCNVACGGHAGNLKVMAHTIELALQNQVCVGAHPSFPDRTHFGRQPMHMSPNELTKSLREQILALQSLVLAKGHRLHHVKPHGALYNQAATDSALAQLLASVVFDIDPQLKFYGLAGSVMQSVCAKQGLTFVAEGFIDRSYTKEGLLLPRSEAGAVLTDIHIMVNRTIDWLQKGILKSVNGTVIKINPATLCLHGDNPQAIDVARQLNVALHKHHIAVSAP